MRSFGENDCFFFFENTQICLFVRYCLKGYQNTKSGIVLKSVNNLRKRGGHFGNCWMAFEKMYSFMILASILCS